MKTVIAIISLGLGLIFWAPTSAQEGTTENISATSGGAATLGTGDASAAPGTVTRDGVTTPSLPDAEGTYGITEVAPPVYTREVEPPVVNVSGETTDVTIVPADGGAPAPVSVSEPIASTETAEPTVADTAVPSGTDQDADNYADALEVEVGLDPGNPDTDGDGLADGDEPNIYGTDAFTWDTDGDGLSDGQEIFATSTDPLLWDTNGDGVGDGAAGPS